MTVASEAGGNSLADDGARRYRPRRYYLYLGIVCTVFFLFMGVGSACVAYWNVDGSFARPKLSALVFGVFWSVWTLLGIWLILCYTRERLVISTTSIEWTGLYKTRLLALDDVTRVKWRLFPQHGSIVLRTPDKRLVIEIGNYLDSERKELILLTRGMFDYELQENWQRFSDRFIQQSPARQNRQRWVLVLLAAMLCAFGVLFLYAWARGLGVQYLALAIANLCVALYYLVCRTTARSRASREGTQGTSRP